MSTLSSELRITGLPTALARTVRRTLRDDYGNDLAIWVDDGGAPCRHCLRLALPGERVILFSYKPFDGPGLYQEMGPVFIHADDCEPFSGDDIPADFQERPLILRPYDIHDHIWASQCITDKGTARETAGRLLADPAVAHLHARSLSRGCYLFKIGRS